MSELHRDLAIHHEGRGADPLLFPHISLHFSPREVGRLSTVQEGNVVFAANVCAGSIQRAIDHEKVVVIVRPEANDAMVFQKAGEELHIMQRELWPTTDGAPVKASRFQGKSHVSTSFREDGGFVLQISGENPGQKKDFLSSRDEGLVIFVGKTRPHTELNVSYRGGIELQRSVSQKHDEKAYKALRHLIEETEQDKMAGKKRASYFESLSDEGDIVLVREIYNPKEVITTEVTSTEITGRAIILLAGTNWLFAHH